MVQILFPSGFSSSEGRPGFILRNYLGGMYLACLWLFNLSCSALQYCVEESAGMLLTV